MRPDAQFDLLGTPFTAPAPAVIERGAELSPCGRYRYRLWRRWGEGAPLVWCMLNPSTADALEDDPTIRRCMGFARRDGHGGIEVANLFALRATDPSALAAADDPVGPLNNAILLGTARAAGTVVAAWGAHAAARERQHVALAYFVAVGARVLCLGATRGGEPRHPLYVRGDQPLVEYRG